MVAEGIQVLVVLPCDSLRSGPLVDAAHKAGIKVISLERLIPGSDLDYMVGFNDDKGGVLQAQWMVRKVPKGRYVLLEAGLPEGVSKDLRHGRMGVLQPLIDRGDIQIAASRGSPTAQNPGGTSEEMKAVLSRNGNKVDAVFAGDEEAAEGAVRALEKAGLAGKVAVAGVGVDLSTCRRILSGTQTMTLYHPPQKLAEETAYLAAKLARKAKEFDCQFIEVDNGPWKTLAVLLTPLAVDAKNLDSTVIKDGVQTREAVYGK
jgi:D-xylose transport system substrate-binding protein